MTVARIGLYYPYVHFHDKSWLKVAALYWPKIARIVPAGYPIDDDANTRALIDGLDFIVNISPDSGKAEASRLMMAGIVNGGNRLLEKYKVYSTSLNRASRRDYRLAADNWADSLFGSAMILNAPLHRFRYLPQLSEDLISKGMAFEDGPWLHVHPSIAWVYMCVLAEKLAKLNNLFPVTDQVWAHSEMSGCTPEQIVRALNHDPPKYVAGQQLDTIVGMLSVRLVVPTGLENVPIQKIIYIRQRYQNDFDAFQDTVSTVAAECRDELNNIAEQAVLEAYLDQVVKRRFEQPLADLRKALRGLGIDTAYSALNTKFALPAAVVASGGIVANQPVVAATGAAAFSVLALGRTARLNWTERMKPSAASYLWRIERNLTPKSLIRSILSH
jgi:hypothetical protein